MITNLAKNQFVISTKNGLYLQSYETLIAFKPRCGDTPVVTSAWDYSATTLRYLKQFLGLNSYSKKDITKMIQAGSIILDDDLTIKGAFYNV